MTYLKRCVILNDSHTRRHLMNLGAKPKLIRLHPDRCNCRACRRTFNLAKRKYKN